jgi:hypothetical protein
MFFEKGNFFQKKLLLKYFLHTSCSASRGDVASLIRFDLYSTHPRVEPTHDDDNCLHTTKFGLNFFFFFWTLVGHSMNL